MEDHGIFYSRSFYPFKNSCERIHFFSEGKDKIQDCLRTLIESARRDPTKARQESRDFAHEFYIGFSVKKPLNGSPVGRTVLRIPKNPPVNAVRSFPCVRTYVVHFLGLELVVSGLAFQQQDTGVSACATTAIWSAVQKVKDGEDIGAATPGQITTLATQFSLSFGRAMPSEGLSTGQMCNAIQALGLSPALIRTKKFESARGALYAAVNSGLAPILIIEDANRAETYHAVTVAGMKLAAVETPEDIGDDIFDAAGNLRAVYVQDDRNGPYLRLDIEKMNGGLSWNIRWDDPTSTDTPELWKLSHILIPTHPKIRISLGELRDIGLEVAADVQAFRDWYREKADDDVVQNTPRVDLMYRVERSYKYIESLLGPAYSLPPEKFNEFCQTVTLPRYIGLLRIKSSYAGVFDVLIDTTGTRRNCHCLALVGRDPTSHTVALFDHLSLIYKSSDDPVPSII